MARIKGGKLTVIYDSSKRQPLDARMLVTKKADLINPDIWVAAGTANNSLFNGLIVAVNNDGEATGVYYLTDRLLITAENYSNYQTALAAGEDTAQYFSMWKKLASLEDLKSLKDRLDSFSNLTIDGGEIA